MTIDISTTKQKLADQVSARTNIVASQASNLINTHQAIYKFSNRVIYSDIRNKDLTGYYYGNAPWYYTPFSSDANWVAQICKLPYRVDSPLAGSDISTVTAAPTNPVSAGTPNITLYVEGCNLQYYVQIERVTVNSTTGVITYTGDISKYDGTLAGSYNSSFPWLSTYATSEVFIGLPDNTTTDSILLIDFYCRGANVDEDNEGFLSAVAFIETPVTDFPSGSY
jgi:hypothetical protein